MQGRTWKLQTESAQIWTCRTAASVAVPGRSGLLAPASELPPPAAGRPACWCAVLLEGFGWLTEDPGSDTGPRGSPAELALQGRLRRCRKRLRTALRSGIFFALSLSFSAASLARAAAPTGSAAAAAKVEDGMDGCRCACGWPEALDLSNCMERRGQIALLLRRLVTLPPKLPEKLTPANKRLRTHQILPSLSTQL